MLKILEGGFFSGAHGIINEEIKKRVEAKKRTYLIVPEQQTLSSEGELAAILPSSYPLYFEVTNFTRLANSTFRALGGIGAEVCDRAKKSLIMWRAVTELSPTLTMTAGSREVGVGVVERALEAVAVIERAGISAQELAAASAIVPKEEGRLIAKLDDLAAIYSLYKRMLHEKYSDNADDMRALIELTRSNPDFFRDAVFYIEGFTSFTEGQYAFLSVLSGLCEVVVSLVLPKENEDAFEYTEPRRTMKRLLSDARRSGAEEKLIRISGASAPEYIVECVNQLWRTNPRFDNNTLHYNNEIEIFECPTPFDECDFIAADIRRRVKAGARYRDFAVIARRSEKYVGIIDASLDKYHIPYFISKPILAEGAEAVKLIYAAIEAIRQGYSTESVIAYAKHTPSSLGRDECDELECYVRLWGISGRGFSSDEVWNMNPDGYTVRHASDMGARLKRLNGTRRRLLAPLLKLEEALGRAGTVEEYATALYAFMGEVRLREGIYKRRDELYLLGEGELAAQYEPIWDIIVEALDTLVSVAGGVQTSTDGFFAQLKVVLSCTDIGRLPTFYDTVSIGSADMIRLFDKKHVYIIGLNRAEFPEAISDRSYFTERDKRTLASLDLALKPDADVRSSKELYILLRAIAYAGQSVSLLYTKKTAGLGEVKPSEVIEKITSMTDGKVKIKRPSFDDALALLYTPEGALDALGLVKEEGDRLAIRRALEKTGLGERVSMLDSTIDAGDMHLSEESRRALAAATLSLSQSKIDTFNNCPLLYFLKYGLCLKPEERAELDTRNVGTFIHAILESFFGEVAEGKADLDTITREEMTEMVRRGADGFLEKVNDGKTARTERERVLSDRLCRAAMPVVENLCEEFRGSKYIPRYFELELGDGENQPEPLVFRDENGECVTVRGTIDRVDTYRTDDELFVRAVDYKTGAKNFSPDDFKEGKNLQLFLYLKAVVESKKASFLADLGAHPDKAPVPSGIIYLKCEVGNITVSTPDATEIDKAITSSQKRKGMILNEDEVISATGIKFSPVRITKKGVPHGSDADRAYSRVQWDEYNETVSAAVCRVASEIKGGNVTPTPKKKDGGCEWCQFKPICRKKI
ncbi:MAG: PD-(D/E)XK nuclease family protein [Clostridia bacterium]|nr:PD-(D/E)XK nuclease family protein [Clostridia bacterium]